MLKQLHPAIKAIILDMDGVLWKDKTPIIDLPKAFARMNDLGLKVILATNNTMKTPEQFAEKLESMGVKVSPEQIINSPMGAAFLVKQRFPKGGPVYIIGEVGTHTALINAGFFHSESEPQAVVVGLDRQITFEKFKQATLLIRKGLPFFGTNPDLTFPVPEGFIPGTGPFLAFLESATGVKPIIAGKPFPYLFNLSFEKLGLPPDQIIGIGDRLETDIAGAQRAGCRSGLVLTGVSTLEDVDKWEPKPDLIAKDLLEMLG